MQRKNKAQFSNPVYRLPKRQGKSGGVLLGAIAFGLAILYFSSFMATQYLASVLTYQSALGIPIFSFLGISIYQPFSWMSWTWQWGSLENDALKHHFMVGYSIIFLGCVSSVFLTAYINYRKNRSQNNNTEHLHGSAHWASKEEVEKCGLLGNKEGVYVGGYEDHSTKTTTTHYLRHNGPEHIIALAPTRSGKGLGLVLPTLLSWLHSVLVLDIKGENYALTAGWRRDKAKNYALKFEPTATDGSSVCFNFLEEIRIGTDKEVADVQNIVTMIVDPDGKGLNDHWAKTGQALLVGAVLHILYAEDDKTLAGVANFLSEPSRTLEDTLNYMLGTEHDLEGKRGWKDSKGQKTGTHPVVAASARDMLNKAENERSGVLSTALSFLTLYRDPIIAKNTSHSEFKIRDLMNADRPVSLYLVVPPSDKDRLKPLIRLIINQVMRILTEKMEFKGGRSVAGYKHRLLLMIDEFPSLGRLEIFQESLAFIAGYGMKAYLITQDISQLWAAYGKDESIISNCHVRIAYAPNKVETAEMLSTMTGTSTVLVDSVSYSGRRLTPMLSNISTTIQEHKRPLLTPDEVMRLPGATKDPVTGDVTEAGDMLIFVANQSPIYGKQVFYFQDPIFSERAKMPAPLESDRLYAPVKNNSNQTENSQQKAPSDNNIVVDNTTVPEAPIDNNVLADNATVPAPELKLDVIQEDHFKIKPTTVEDIEFSKNEEKIEELEKCIEDDNIAQPPKPDAASAYGMFDDLLPPIENDKKANHSHNEQEI